MRLILPLERIRLNFKLEDLMRKIQMVDLKSQYQSIKEEVKVSMDEVLESTAFINGPKVHEFQKNLENYLGVKHVIPALTELMLYKLP